MQAIELMEALARGEQLDRACAEQMMDLILGGEQPEPWIAGALMALRVRGATPTEIAGFAAVIRRRGVVIPDVPANVVDSCGTGGGAPSWNLSTGAAILAAAAGATIAKHGNRAVTSACGSADVLEALGISLATTPAEATRELREAGISFLFAPSFHPGLRVVAAVRKSLGVRTVFNLLGPLANPAGAKRQLLGVYDPALVSPVAEALAELGTERAWVVCGKDGLDEVSPNEATIVAEVKGNEVSMGELEPADFGIKGTVDLAPGSSLQENAAILRAALTGDRPEASEALVPNAACCLVLSGLETDLKTAAERARETIRSGDAGRKLEAWKEVSSR